MGSQPSSITIALELLLIQNCLSMLTPLTKKAPHKLNEHIILWTFFIIQKCLILLFCWNRVFKLYNCREITGKKTGINLFQKSKFYILIWWAREILFFSTREISLIGNSNRCNNFFPAQTTVDWRICLQFFFIYKKKFLRTDAHSEEKVGKKITKTKKNQKLPDFNIVTLILYAAQIKCRTSISFEY